MTINASKESNRLVIKINGAFDFKSRTEFLKAYHGQSANSSYVIDFQGVVSVDSSALGMLILLREHAGGDESDIVFERCRPPIRKLFELAQFDKLFKLE